MDLHDVEVIEGCVESSFAEQCAALQRAINGGNWSLQGSYGRAMMGAIESGQCMLGEKPARDYWGNRIPARSEVQAGTKGSREFVVARMGEAHAAMLEAA